MSGSPFMLYVQARDGLCFSCTYIKIIFFRMLSIVHLSFSSFSATGKQNFLVLRAQIDQALMVDSEPAYTLFVWMHGFLTPGVCGTTQCSIRGQINI